MSVVVQRLVDKGLVARARSGGDARRLELSLTPPARALLLKAPDAAQQRLIEALERIPPPARRRFAATLARLVDDLGAGKSGPRCFLRSVHG